MRGLGEEKSNKKWRLGVFAAAAVGALLLFTNLGAWLRLVLSSDSGEGICPIVDLYRPLLFYKDNSTVLKILQDELFKQKSVKKLQGAVKVDTQVYDNPPDVDEDPEYWVKFVKFHEYLKNTFPTVFEKLDVHKVNTYGLVLHWKGLDADLKPLMLTAHQDTVPVQKQTLNKWTYPPFEGHFDGEWLYGRGSSDCKNLLVSLMETLELLVDSKFSPKRGIIVALGMDEEVSGWKGANAIARFLEEKFGRDSMYAIIDEGSGVTEIPETGRIIAIAGTGEKGYVDVNVELTTPGGHSSVPPDHTSIGLMSQLAVLIEQDPFSPIFSPKNPAFHQTQCAAVHDGGKMPKLLRKSILRAGYDKLANSYVVKKLAENPVNKYLFQTSQALDIVNGGEKNNALPENVRLLANHRVAIESTVGETKEVFIQRVVEVAKKNKLGVTAFGEEILPEKGLGSFILTTDGKATETAPVTPIGDDVWKYLGGVTRHIYEDFVFPDSEPVIFSPGIMTGNTDTRHYWNLTSHIFRYSPVFSKDVMKESHIHSVDEKIRFSSHLHLVAFFHQYILAVNKE